MIELSDGRDLAWTELGNRDGTAVFAFHGSPGTGREFSLYDETASESGIRLIAVDRPGYGGSSYHRSRRLSDWPADVSQLADHLSLERFGVIGHSAGGPHALACARFLPDRLLACGVLSGPAPQARTPMTEGMMVSNRLQTTVYRHWPRSLDTLAVGLWLLTWPLVAPVLWHSRRHPDRGLDRMLKILPPCDVAVMMRPQVRANLLDEVSAFGPAVLRTSVQDMAVGIREWGFDLEDIPVPVHIWHGDSDYNIPVAHAQALAKAIPGARMHLCPGEGHWVLVDHMTEILTVFGEDQS